MKILSITGIIVFTAVIAVGCATTSQKTPQLNQAQKAYSQVLNDPQVSQYAPVALYEAGQALEKAENVKSETERRHFAYLAETKIELAKTIAAEAAAENQVAQLRAEQEDMMLKAHTQELERAQQQTWQAQEQLRAYRSEQQEQQLTQALQGERTYLGIMLTFGDVLFEYNKTDLKSGAQRSISKLADFLKTHPQRQVVIEGHTDNRGPEEYNRQLALKRAEAVANVLKTQGISADRITIRGMGEQYPIAPNTTFAGRQANRRVEILIPTGQPGVMPETPGGT
jgi:outer membrane protein OmpA-like peptidoglycan-associated protein